ncbi:MAG: phosphoadenosine phosphosulfate reductase family protein [Candidatus Neomarinimicrobiota bacterium]|jgi:predicted phosphoadenosine phosphosulfate sulfurtransferase
MPTQRYGTTSVLEAARARLRWVFDHFDEIIVSVSGGKDSTALAHLALAEAKRRGRRIGMFFLDEEVVYQSSADQVEYLMTLEPDHTIPMWLQVEFRLTNATSTTEGQLICWEAGKHKLWMRPKKAWSIQHAPWDRATETVRDRRKGFGFYDAIENFERCYEGAAFLVGLRAAGESPNRWRAVSKNPVTVDGDRIYWGTQKGSNVALYPLFDWNFHDVWRYIAESGVRYSKIYDMQFRKGYPIHEMRVSSLIHERAFRSICDLPEFEPRTYDRLLKRVKGISLAQEHGKKDQLFRARKLPKNLTSWREYRDHLLRTHQDRERVGIFERRFARQLDNEYVARQQVRQLVLNDYENNLAVDNAEDPRAALVRYYDEVL